MAGVHVNDTSPQKQTAVHFAALHDRASIATILLDSGINYDAVDENLNNGEILTLLTVVILLLRNIVRINLTQNCCLCDLAEDICSHLRLAQYHSVGDF